MPGPTPYRKPSPTPPPEPNVVTLAESPQEREAREKRELLALRQKSNHAQTARVLAELEAAQAAFSQKMRLVGGALTAISLALLWHDASSIAEGADHIYVGRIGSAMYLVGPVLLIVGGGGAASPDSVPNWWRVGVVGTFLAGVAFGPTLHVELAQLAAELFFL